MLFKTDSLEIKRHKGVESKRMVKDIHGYNQWRESVAILT